MEGLLQRQAKDSRLARANKIRYLVYYIDHWPLWLDLKILFKTVWVVIFKREGIYGKDGVTRDYGR